MNKEQALLLLQGKWKSNDNNVSFEIVDRQIINIKGYKVNKTLLDIKWNDTFKIWEITVQEFSWVSALITKLDKWMLNVYDYRVRVLARGVVPKELPETQLYTFQRMAS